MKRPLRELRRRNVFRVAAAYIVLAWLLLQVADVTFEPLGLLPWTLRLVLVLLALGFPIACIRAWAYEVTPERTESGAGADATGIPAALARQDPAETAPTRARAAALPVSLPAESLAILPFVNMSPDPDQDYSRTISVTGSPRRLSTPYAAYAACGWHRARHLLDSRAAGKTAVKRPPAQCRLGAGRECSQAGDRVRINAQLFAAWLDQRARSLDYIELTVQMRPEGYTGLYNAACASAIQGERDRALKLPDRAVSNGRGYLRWIGSDADLANLCGDPRFEAIVHRIRSMDQPAA